MKEVVQMHSAMIRNGLMMMGLLFQVVACGPAEEGLVDEDLTASNTSIPVNDDATKILIYTNNVENLPTSKVSAGDGTTCAGDWQDLIYYMKKMGGAPDIFLVQQISDAEQLDNKLAAKMRELLGVEYGTIIAEQNPAYWDPSDCAAKHYQTNAIVYRKARFSYVAGSKQTFRSVVDDNGQCVTADAARYVNVAAKLQDKMQPFNGGFKEIAVASVHWPVVDGCGVTNAVKTDIMMNSYSGAQMYIWGGDINLPELDKPEQNTSGYKSWYVRTNAALGDPSSLGYRDPVYEACDAQTGDETNLKQCLIQNATMKFGSRYDFLFAKYKSAYKKSAVATAEPKTVSFDTADEADALVTGSDNRDLGYSMHRAVSAYFYW
jgi:hypothetical protein